MKINTDTILTDEILKKYSPIPNNYNLTDIQPFKKIAENIWLIPLIGGKMYAELLTQVQNNNVSPENSSLLYKVFPFLAFCTIYEALPFLTFKITQKSITKEASEDSQTVDHQDYTIIQTHLRAEIESLKTELIKFIKRNNKCYPDIDLCCEADNDNYILYNNNK